MSTDLDRAPADRHERAWLWFLRHAPKATVRAAASAAARTHPLALEPGWHFDFSADDPRPLVRFRRDLWTYFKRGGIEEPVTIGWYDGLKIRS